MSQLLLLIYSILIITAINCKFYCYYYNKDLFIWFFLSPPSFQTFKPLKRVKYLPLTVLNRLKKTQKQILLVARILLKIIGFLGNVKPKRMLEIK